MARNLLGYKAAMYFPEHLAGDILSRLPSKSLLRFKSVCKSWYSFISNPDFITRHSQRFSRNPKFLCLTYASRFVLLDESDSSALDESCLSAPFSFPVDTPNDNAQVVLGSSCGLVCVASGHLMEHGCCFGRLCDAQNCGSGLFLWNPFTRETRAIPDLGTAAINYHCYVHGFGHDPVSNDLKLVVSKSESSIIHVFSVKSNSWKSITAALDSDFLIGQTNATVLKGVFYWNRCTCLVAFDPTEAKVSELKIPEHDPRSRGRWLSEHKGCLCISFHLIKPEHVLDIWMWKEHGWSHSFSVSMEHIKRFPGCQFWSFGVSRSGDQVLLHTLSHILRSTKDDKFEGVEINIEGVKINIYGAIMCAETLVSPDSYGRNLKKI